MKIEITAKPVFHFDLSFADIALLTKLSRNHYDARCQGLSLGVAQAGRNGLLLIWGMAVQSAQDGETTVPATADRGELDTLLKCMELAQYLKSADEQARVSALRAAFYGALRRSCELQDRWIDEYNSEASPPGPVRTF